MRMAMMKKWLLPSAVACILGLFAFLYAIHIAFAEGKTATLAIIGESQKGVILCPTEVSIEEGETAYSLLQKVMGDKVIAENTKYGMYITGIDGLMAGETSGWTYDVNDQAAMVGADQYQVQSGDVVAFRYVVDWNEMQQETLQQVLDKVGTCKQELDPVTPEEKNPEEQNPEEQQPEEPIKNELVMKQVDAAIAKTSQKMMQDGLDSDWEAIALARSGQTIPSEMKISYLQSLTQKVEKRLDRFTATDLARTILAVTAVDGNPTQVAGKNLIEEMYQSEKLNSITSYAFGLLALDTKNYEVPAEANWNRAAFVQEMLHAQHTDGGWTYDVESSKESASNIDVTGMVLSALAPYQQQPEVKQAVEKAVQFLSTQQMHTGGFGADGQENSNSTAQVIIGLAAAGIDPAGQAFTKNNVNAVQNLISYQLTNGEFKWLPNEEEGNSMATEQALLALVQYRDYVNGNGSIYDWTNVSAGTDTNPIVEPEKPTVEIPENIEGPEQQTNHEQSHVAIQEKTVNNEKAVQNRELPNTGGKGLEAAIPVGTGIVCIASAYVLWRRKAA